MEENLKMRIRFQILILAAAMIFACTAARGECALQDLLSRIEDSDHPVVYTIATTEYGEMTPSEEYSPVSFISVLLQAEIEPADSDEAPEGQYVVLNFPTERVRFDFFLAKEDENYFRQVSEDGSEELFTAELPDDVFISLGNMMEVEANIVALMNESTQEFEADWPEDGWIQTSLDGKLWINGRTLLEITEEDDELIVDILSFEGSEDATVWMYLCYYDAKDDALHSIAFSSSLLTFDEKGKEKREKEMVKACNAVFSQNDSEQLVIRNAGDERLEGRVFKEVVDED